MALIDGLVSYYKLDENAANTTVEDVHGSNTGTATTNTSNLFNANGVINSALDFNGSNEGVGLGAVVITATDDFSMSCWVKPDLDDSGTQVIISNGQPGANGWYLRWNSGEFFFAISGSGITAITGVKDVWQHVVLVRRSGTNYFYLDASETNVGTASIISYTTASRIADGASAFFDGSVDEVGFWNKALSQAEVTELYNSGNGLAYPFSVAATLRLIKIAGTFVEKPILTKVAGTFVDKPIKIKIGGTFVDA